MLDYIAMEKLSIPYHKFTQYKVVQAKMFYVRRVLISSGNWGKLFKKEKLDDAISTIYLKVKQN